MAGIWMINVMITKNESMLFFLLAKKSLGHTVKRMAISIANTIVNKSSALSIMQGPRSGVKVEVMNDIDPVKESLQDINQSTYQTIGRLLSATCIVADIGRQGQ
jgi:hypothetical protein